MRLRFGDCILDTDVRELRRAGGVIPLSPKAFRLLEVLAERRPAAVSKDELRGLLWPDALLGGTTLARLVNEVRSATLDRARPARFIRTVQRFGYAFCASAVEERSVGSAPACRFALQWGARQIPLAPGENLIGRAPDALISVASPKVSRWHARILVSDGRAMLEDLGSKNGTRLGEARIDGSVELRHEDRIVVGPVLLIFRAFAAEKETRSDTRR